MSKKELMIIADYSEASRLTLQELCEACQISSDLIHELISYGILKRREAIKTEWAFDLAELRRVQSAIRLQRDLEVNLAGVALVLDLLDELHDLRKEAEILERYFRSQV